MSVSSILTGFCGRGCKRLVGRDLLGLPIDKEEGGDIEEGGMRCVLEGFSNRVQSLSLRNTALGSFTRGNVTS